MRYILSRETYKSRLSKKSRPADMCGWTGHIQGNLALRVCEPLCGECAVRRQILSPGTAKLRRVLRTKQPKRSRGSGLPFSSAILGAQKMQGTATIRGKEFLSRDCAQKWVPPKAWRFCDTRKAPVSQRGHRGLLLQGVRRGGPGSSAPRPPGRRRWRGRRGGAPALPQRRASPGP